MKLSSILSPYSIPSPQLKRDRGHESKQSPYSARLSLQNLSTSNGQLSTGLAIFHTDFALLFHLVWIPTVDTSCSAIQNFQVQISHSPTSSYSPSLLFLSSLSSASLTSLLSPMAHPLSLFPLFSSFLFFITPPFVESVSTPLLLSLLSLSLSPFFPLSPRRCFFFSFLFWFPS